MLTDWRVAVTAAIFCTGVLLTCIETNAQSIPKEIASRVEIYAIPSLTLSDQQFLTGDASGTAYLWQTATGQLIGTAADPCASSHSRIARVAAKPSRIGIWMSISTRS